MSEEKKPEEIKKNRLKEFFEISKENLNKFITHPYIEKNLNYISFTIILLILIIIRIQNPEGAKKKLLDLKNERKSKEEEIEKLNSEMKSLSDIDVDKELEIYKKYEEQKKQNDVIQDSINLESSRIKEVEDLIERCNDLRLEIQNLNSINIEDEILKCDVYSSNIEKNNKLNSEINLHKSSIKDVLSFKEKISYLNDNIDSRNKELLHLKEHKDVCPVCKQIIDKSLNDELVSKKEKELQELNSSLLEEQSKYNLQKEENDKLHKKIEELKSEIINDLESPKYTKEYLQNISKDLNNKIKDKDNLAEKIEDSEVQNKKIQSSIAELCKKIKKTDETKFSIDFLNGLKAKIENFVNLINQKKQEIQDISSQATGIYDKGYVSNLNEKRKKVLKDISKDEDSLLKENTENKHFEVLINIFSNKEGGFKKFFISKIIDMFNVKVNLYISLFFEDKIKITFDRNLTETVLLNGNEVNFNSFSSGQKTRFELAISFALFVLVKTFFSGVVNLLVFDEVLDKNLDERGFNSVVNILNTMSDSNSIFVVSHQEFYKDKFKKRVSVKLNSEGFSYIDGEI